MLGRLTRKRRILPRAWTLRVIEICTLYVLSINSVSRKDTCNVPQTCLTASEGANSESDQEMARTGTVDQDRRDGANMS